MPKEKTYRVICYAPKRVEHTVVAKSDRSAMILARKISLDLYRDGEFVGQSRGEDSADSIDLGLRY
jgi:hypothetical protein